jgi:predicted molibdopterin-dependent oxidoreductase YjgC
MFRRLEQNAVATVSVSINGQPFAVPQGETVAAAMVASGLTPTRTTPLSGSPRAPLCLMGVCYECLMVIDGLPNQRACQVPVAEGMQIQIQQSLGA